MKKLSLILCLVFCIAAVAFGHNAVIMVIGLGTATPVAKSLNTSNAFVNADLLVAYLFDDGSGSTVSDYTTHAHDATLSATDLWSTNGVTVDETDEFIRAPNLGFTTGESAGISVFMVFTSTGQSGAGASSGIGRFFDDNNTVLLARSNSDTLIYAEINGVSLGSWTVPDLWDEAPHTLLYVADPTNDTITIYIDGETVGTNTATFTIPTMGTYVHIGNRSALSRESMLEFSAFYAWDTVLDSDDAASLHNYPYQLFQGMDAVDPPPVEPTPNIYYVTQSGTGHGSSAGSPMSVANHNAGSFLPNDIIYLSGTITTNIIPPNSGTAGNRIIYDGDSTSDCDPTAVMCNTFANVNSRFYLGGKHHIEIRNIEFGAGSTRIYDDFNVLSKGIWVERNIFGRASGGSTMRLSVAEDVVVAFNRFTSNYDTTVSGNVVLQGGDNNHIIGNEITGGLNSIYLTLARHENLERNHSRFIIAGNLCIDFKEEGISFDTSSVATGRMPAVDADTVSASSSTTITLNHANWTGTADKFIGYYIIFLSGDLIGKRYLITDQANKVFTVSGNPSAAVSGDRVAISLIFQNGYIGYNSVDMSYRYDDDGILMYGGNFDTLVENNTVGGSNINIRSRNDMAIASSSVTGGGGKMPSGYNLVYNNTLLQDGRTDAGRINFDFYDMNNPNTGTIFQSRGNTAIGNSLAGQLRATQQLFYESGNTGGYTDNWISSTMNAAHSWSRPYITAVAVNASTVTITWNETVVTTGYAAGDFYLTTGKDIATHIDLSSPTGSGNSRTFTTSTPITVGQTVKVWFIPAADTSIVDAGGDSMTVLGYKTVTNNTP